MNLKDKLKRFATSEQKEPTEKKEAPINLESLLGGTEVETPFGSCHLVESVLGLSVEHGTERLGQILEIDGKALAFVLRDSDLQGFEPANCVFFDTETTGLAGGTGTYAFLIGVGLLVGDSFKVKQYLMRDYHEELAVLDLVWQDLRRARYLVSFNGKRFDWPLIKDRFTLARFTPIRPEPLHIDLLHPSRRLWKDRLTSCSLNSLEVNQLAIFRESDVPGSEVPQRYFDFLQTGDGRLLQDVLKHNLIDILSLATLTCVLAKKAATRPANLNCPFEAKALGDLYAKEQNYKIATEYYSQALRLAKDKPLKVSILQRLAASYKKLGKWPLAEEIWLDLAQEVEDLASYEELAKYYEHIKKDLKAAISCTKRALSLAFRYHPPQIGALEYRLARLERKQQRHVS